MIISDALGQQINATIMPMSGTTPIDILQKIFGYPSFRGDQSLIIEAMTTPEAFDTTSSVGEKKRGPRRYIHKNDRGI